MYNLFQFCIICLGHADAKAATSAALAKQCLAGIAGTRAGTLNML